MGSLGEKKLRVLVLGSGGREHALCWKIAQSSRLEALFALPGNPGIAAEGIACLNGSVTDFPEVKRVVLENRVDLVVVGPEVPIVLGIADFFEQDSDLRHVRILAPSASGARLEGSKSFAKDFMTRHSIPTARYRVFTREDRDAAEVFLRTLLPPYVLKADGLAAGKGVLICPDFSQAYEALETLWAGQFGEASETVVIEEYLQGIELSVFVLTDGKAFIMLPEAKDYKRALEGDRGLNTGGMGAVSPVPFADDVLKGKIEERIVRPTLLGLQKEGIPFRGFLFLGLMCTPAGDPHVIEYNVRLGDPETQVVLPRITGDFLHCLEQAAIGALDPQVLGTGGQFCATISLTSSGYPEAYPVGKAISLPTLTSDQMLFHAGTRRSDGVLLTSGGRVFSACGLGDSLNTALDKAYLLANSVRFDGVTFRRDIGKDLGLRPE